MAEELVRLTNENDEMEEQVQEIPQLRIQLKVSAADMGRDLLNIMEEVSLRG